MIVLSQKLLFNKRHVITLFGNETDNFIFLITTPSRNDHVINFQILYNGINENGSENITLPLDIISCPNKSREILYTVENKKSISEMLGSYTPIKKTKYLKKVTERLELREDEEEAPIALKKPRKPRTKRNKLEEGILIEPIVEEGILIEPPIALKKPRKPRTKKNKLEEGILIEPIEVENK
jgi:hypothetical protein